MFISHTFKNRFLSSKQTVENALKTNEEAKQQQAHGSSSMIMENALIIDECFVSFPKPGEAGWEEVNVKHQSNVYHCLSASKFPVSPARQFIFSCKKVSSKLKVTFHI